METTLAERTIESTGIVGSSETDAETDTPGTAETEESETGSSSMGTGPATPGPGTKPPEHDPGYIKRQNELRVERWVDNAEFWLPARELPTSAVHLWTYVRDCTRVSAAQVLAGSDLRFRVCRIGGENWTAAVCRAPDIREAEQFWRILCMNNISHIVNINPAGVAEDYYPEDNHISIDFPGLRVMQVLPSGSRTEDNPPASKRSRHEAREDKPAGSARELSITFRNPEGQTLSHRILMTRLTDWQDGHGYDHKTLIRLARIMPRGKTLVHCQAGLGRSGTLAVTMQLVDLYDRGLLSRTQGVEVLASLILEGRKDRGSDKFVTAIDQFECLLRVLKHLFRFRERELVQQVNEYLGLLPRE